MARFASTMGSLNQAIDTVADQVTSRVAAATSNSASSPVQMTAAQALSGVFVNTTNGAISVYLPTPADMLATVPNIQVGSTIDLWIRQDGDNTLTLSTNSVSGITLSGTATIATTLGQKVIFKITNATTGAYTAYVMMKVAN